VRFTSALVRRHWREVVVNVLCSCVPAYGHYLPMVGVARALQDAGHDVTFVTGAGFDVPAVDGFSLRVAGEDTLTPAMRAIAAAPQFPTWSPAEQRAFIVRHVFAGERLATGFDDQLAAARDLNPDAIVHDPMELAAPLIAALLGRANVCVGYGLAFRPELQAAAADGVADRWRRYGIETPPDAGIHGNLYLDPCPPSLADPNVPVPRARQPLRPWLPESDHDRAPERVSRLGDRRPMIYVTLGTLFGRVGLQPMAVMIEGLRRLDVDVVATVGPDCDPLAVDPEDPGVVVERFVPQDLILNRCSLAVIHGGSGSVLGALQHGLPIVVVPLGADQFENAAAIERAGAGIVVTPDRLTADTVADAAAQGLSDDGLRNAATRIAAELSAMPAVSVAVPRIEQLVRVN
jgi:UDP:flavonoid glycosyltransferase YjiC (YdhE family)